QHLAGSGRDGKEGRVGLPSLRSQRRQNDIQTLIVGPKHLEQGLVEQTCLVTLRRRVEFVVKPKLVEEAAQAGIVVMREARMLAAERVGHRGERVVEVRREHVSVGYVVGYLSEAVHVVGEADQPGFAPALGQDLEGVTHHGGTRHLTERADVWQSGGTVAGLEDYRLVGTGLADLQWRDNAAGPLD